MSTLTSFICPNQHEKNEWSRLATWAYAKRWNDIGHTFSCAASLSTDGLMGVQYFDALQKFYRYWLVFGMSRRMADELPRTMSGFLARSEAAND